MYGDDGDNSPTEDTTSKSTEKGTPFKEKPHVNVQPRNTENDVPARSTLAAKVENPKLKDKPAPKPSTSTQSQVQNPPIQTLPSRSNEELNAQKIKRQQDKPSAISDRKAIEAQKGTIIQAALPTDHRFCSQEKGSYIFKKDDKWQKDHLSIACHLFPRLSETNLQFHDISWNYEQFPDGNKRAILRKRMVKVCVLMRILSIRHEKRPINIEPNTTFEVTFCLVDCRPRAENQIISNLHSCAIPLQTGRRNFLSKVPLCSVLVRSNYAHKDVKLRISLRQINTGIEIGRVDLQLLDEDKKPVWRANARSHSNLFGEFRMNLEFCEFSTRQAQMQTDYLPDVLICEENWIGMLACYRQMMCQIIAYHRENLPPSTSINDIVLASFPRIFENKALANAFIKLLVKERILTNSGSLFTGSQPIPAQNIHMFRETYAINVLPFVKSLASPQEPNLLQKDMDTIQANGALALFAEQKSSPICSSDYILYLSGSHALD